MSDSEKELWINDKEYHHIRPQLNSAYHAWRNGKFGNGPWYIWFEHHAEINLGIKCEIDYNSRIAHNVDVVDKEKFMMFMLKYS
jgi:hypothetical protein